MTKTEFTPLPVTAQASHRVFVGLGWDPYDAPSIKDRLKALIGIGAAHHDLDLSCYYFDQNKNLLGYVAGDPEHYSEPSGTIYHSGDDVEGIGDGDDEQISVELKNLSPEIHHLVFRASIKSGHNFHDIKVPEIRLCDGYSGHSFLQQGLTPDDDGLYNSFLFVQLKREGEKWVYRNLCHFGKQKDFSDLSAAFADLLD